MFKRFGSQILRTVFRVQAGEGVRVGVMLIYSLAAVGGVIITGQLVSRALFLSNLPESAIPYKFILPPLILMVTTAIYTRFAGRWRRDHLIVVSCALMVLGVGAFRLLLETQMRSEFTFLCALFVFFDVVGDVVVLQFWTFAADLFNAREGRRLFGLIAGGSTLSNVLFGAVLSAVAHAVAPENLIFVMLISLLVCLGCAGFLGRRYGAALDAEKDQEEDADPALLAVLRRVVQTPLVLTMSGIVVVVALASNIADYQLDLALQRQYGSDGQGMIGFLGQFRLWAGLIAFVLQFFLAGRLLERFGVVAALLLLPSAMALGAGGVLLTGGALWAAALPRACDVVLKYTINDAAFNLLYLPVAAQVRARAKAVLDGLVRPPVISLLGLAFLGANHFGMTTVLHWSLPLLALVVLWIGLVVRAARQYVNALSDSVQMRRLDLDEERVDLTDESSVKVLRQTLQADDTMQVIHALTLLPQVPNRDWGPQVAALLDHPDPQVRSMALEYLARTTARPYADQVRALLDDKEITVQAAAIETLCALEELESVRQVVPFLEHDDPHIRAATVLGLIKHTGLDGLLHAGESFKALLGHNQARARLEGVRVLEVLQVPTFYHPLIPLLEDPDIEVQIGALRAAARIKAPELVDYLLPKLAQPYARWYATEAVIHCIGTDLDRVATLLDDAQQPVEVRRQLTTVLQQQGSQEAAIVLATHIDAPDDLLRADVYQALLALGAVGLSLPLEHGATALDAELRRAYSLHALRRDIAAAGALPLLTETVEVHIQRAHDRILWLLALLHNDSRFAWVAESLHQSDTRQRATAIELLDNLIARDASEIVLPLFATADAERLEVAQRRFGLEPRAAAAVLTELIAERDTWLCACALHAAGELALTDLAITVEIGLAHQEPLVRQTALAACHHLHSTTALQPLLHRFLATESDAANIAFAHKSLAGDHAMALSTIEKVFFLKSASLFVQIPGEEAVDLVPIAHEVAITRGTTFIRQGEEGDCLFIVVEGQVSVEIDGQQVRISRSREVLGELAVLSEQPRTANCTALSDVVALRIDKKDFWKLLHERPQIAVDVMKVLVQRYIPTS